MLRIEQLWQTFQMVAAIAMSAMSEPLVKGLSTV